MNEAIREVPLEMGTVFRVSGLGVAPLSPSLRARETRADIRRAVLSAIAFHVLVISMLFVGLRWSAPASGAGEGRVIEAELVDSNALSPAMRRALQALAYVEPQHPASTQPRPSVEPQDAVADPPKAVVKEADARDSAEHATATLQPATPVEKNGRTESAAEAAMSGSASRSPESGESGVDAHLSERYATALNEAIDRAWTRPEAMALGEPCRITIHQRPGGGVIDVVVSASCPYDEAGRRSIEDGVRKAQPLPYAGFESVFETELILDFRPSEA